MLAEWVQETTATTGTGTTLTLTAATGFCRFSARFAVGDLVSYMITDGSNREKGFGTVAAGNTLTRSIVTGKFESGVYSDYPATPLSLSGSATIFVSPHMHSHMPGMPFSGSNFILSEHLTEIQASSIALTANWAHCYPFKLAFPRKIKGFAVGVSGAATAGKVCRIGFYACNTSGQPGKLLGQVSFAADSTGTKLLSVALGVLKPGWYYSVFSSDGSPSFHANQYAFGTQTPLGALSTTTMYQYGRGDVIQNLSANMPDPAPVFTPSSSMGSPKFLLEAE